MVRQRDNVAVYKVISKNTGAKYYVELLRLDNNYYGNPRYEAHIIRVDFLEECDYCGAHVFRFTGHYMSEQDECDWIVDYFEKKLNKLHN